MTQNKKLQAIVEETEISIEQISGKSKAHDIVQARRAACYFLALDMQEDLPDWPTEESRSMLNTEIADLLDISVSSVSSFIRDMENKLIHNDRRALRMYENVIEIMKM